MKPTNRIFSMVLAVVFVFGTLVPSALARDVTNYEDSAPVDMPQNIVKDPANLNALVGLNGAAGTIFRGDNYSLDAQKMVGYLEKSSLADDWYGAGPNIIESGYLNAGITEGTAYVVSMRLANGAPQRKATLDAAFCYGVRMTPLCFKVSSSEFETYTGSFVAESNSTYISLGFNTNIDRTAVTDETRGLLLHDYSNGGSLYVAPEVAYTMEIDVDTNGYISPGSTPEVSTRILNQLGNPGCLSQNVEYKVLNGDRSAVAENISIVSHEGKTMLVTDENTLPGKYVVYASAKDYDIQKGLEIEVMDPTIYVDYVPGVVNDNFIDTPYNINTFTGSNGAGGTRPDYNNEKYVILNEKINKSDDNYFGAGPVYFDSMDFIEGKDYVVSINLRNGDPDACDTAYFGFNYGVYGTPVSYAVTNTEFEEYCFTFRADKSTKSMHVGFDATKDNSSKTEDELSTLHISMEEGKGFYVAEEKAHNITLEPLEEIPAELSKGMTIDFDAELVNQKGRTGFLPQDFSWVVLEDGKTSFAEGMTITPSQSDSGRATLTIDKTPKSGTYYVIAKSKTHPEFIRSFSVVADPKTEFTRPDMPENLFPAQNINSIDGYTQSNGSGGIRTEYDGESYINLVESGIKDTWFGAGPVYKNITGTLTEGKSYVAAFNVRNASPDITPTLYLGINHGTNNPTVSVPVTNTEYEQKKLVFTALSPSDIISFGFDATREAKTENLGNLQIDFTEGNEPYLAEEIPYELEITPDEDLSVLVPGESITAKAELLNQLDFCGSLEQDFIWQVLDVNKTPIRNGFDLEVSDDTTEASLSLDTNVRRGTYYLSAEATGYDGIVRFLEFKVKRPSLAFYVSPNGDDSADGGIVSPFRTLERARDAVRDIASKDEYKSVDVILRGGEYTITDTLYLSEEDSGGEDFPVIYRAYPGETPVIKSTAMLDASLAREPLKEDIVRRIRPEAQGKLVVFDLEENGISDSDIVDLSGTYSGFYGLTSGGEQNTLFIDGKEQIISSWPNDRDYATRGNAIVEEVITNQAGTTTNVSKSFYYLDSEPDRWAEAEDWYIGAFIPYDYSYARMSGKAVDTEKKIISVDPSYSKTDLNFTNNFTKRWKAFNLLEEIDLPGEYYVDTVNKLLYLYPPYDLEDSRIEITVNRGNLIDIERAKNITFRGITFYGAGASAIVMEDVRNIDVESCTFDGIQGVAVIISGTVPAQTNKDYWQRQYLDGSYDVDIRDNIFVNLGSTAVNMNGGNVDTLTPSGNIIENNLVSNFATKTTNNLGGAFSISGCGHIVRHNHIGNSVSAGVNVDGNDHIIEYNEMYNLLREYQDAGVIYQGRNALARGTVIRYNYIHDCYPLESMSQSSQVAIYMDDAQQGITAVGNIIQNIKLGFHSNGGGMLHVEGNTMIDVFNRPWSFINQPNGYMKDPVVVRGPGGTVEFIGSQIYDRELYFDRYDGLEEFVTQGRNPKFYTVIKDNLAVRGGTPHIGTEEEAYSAVSGNLTTTDSPESIFVDAARKDYRISSDSPFAKDSRVTEGNFDIEDIGMQNNFALEGSLTQFVQSYPADGSVVAPSDEGLILSWSRATGATDYLVEIARDSEFEDIVFSASTRVNTINAGTPDAGRYYWRVTAVNTSREICNTWESANFGTSFTLREFEHSVSLENTSLDEDGTKLCVKSRVVNNTVVDDTDFSIILAVYSGDKLEHTKIFCETIAPGEAYSLDYTLDTEGSYTPDEIKIFVWKDGSLTPVRQARLMSIK